MTYFPVSKFDTIGLFAGLGGVREVAASATDVSLAVAPKFTDRLTIQ